MSEHTTEETLMYLQQCLLPGSSQDGIDLEIPSWLVREVATALETESRRGWQEAWKKAEAKLARLEEKLLAVLEVAVARGEKLGYADEDYRDDLASLPTQQKPTEEGMEEA